MTALTCGTTPNHLLLHHLRGLNSRPGQGDSVARPADGSCPRMGHGFGRGLRQQADGSCPRSGGGLWRCPTQ